MIETLVKDPWSILTIIMTIVVLSVLHFNGKKKEVKKLILHLIDVAEEVLGPKTGLQKHGYVVEKLYPFLPKIITMIYTKDDIDMLVKKLFQTTKYYLEN